MIKIEITTPESFFESDTWKKDISKHIIQNLNNSLHCSRFVKRKYGLDISSTTIMKKAKALQDTKPKIPRPKIKGKLKKERRK